MESEGGEYQKSADLELGLVLMICGRRRYGEARTMKGRKVEKLGQVCTELVGPEQVCISVVNRWFVTFH